MSPLSRDRNPSLADVGREAGVSSMAASVVLNNPKTSARISPATRQRIIEAAERLGYRPNCHARRTAAVRTQTIGVTMAAQGGQVTDYMTAIHGGILAAAADFEQSLHSFLLPTWDVAAGRLDRYCEQRIDGMILIAPTMSQMAIKAMPDHLPIVTIHSNNPMTRVVDITSDDQEGAMLATNHLIDLGHRRILHLAGPERLTGGNKRLAGWRRAMVDAGLDHDADQVVRGLFYADSAEEAMVKWMAENKGIMPTAIFAANDGMARGCITALLRHGLRVPEDVSVVGFDDLPIAVAAEPYLTTVAQPFRRLGIRSVMQLLNTLASGELPPLVPQPVVLPVQLVVRHSTCHPPERPVRVPCVKG